MSKEELTHIIKRIDDREQMLAYSSAVLGVVVGVVLTIALVHLNPPLHKKNHESPGFLELEGVARVVLAGLVALAAWKRRRSFVAFALLILGTSMTPGALFALPFWALGIWMIFRVLKWQKELAALTGGQARPGAAGTGRPGPRRGRGPTAGPGGAPAGAAGGWAAREETTRAGRAAAEQALHASEAAPAAIDARRLKRRGGPGRRRPPGGPNAAGSRSPGGGGRASGPSAPPPGPGGPRPR